MFIIRESLTIGILYLSAIIGAGFASGREIMIFFGRYGYTGFIGLGISCILIGFCGSKALDAVKNKRIENPHELNVVIGGNVGGRIITLLCGLFAYSAYIIMLAGIKQLTNGSVFVVVLVSICAYVVLYKGFDTLAKICGILAPIAVILIMALAFYGSLSRETHILPNVEYEFSIGNLILKSFMYAGYNVLTSLCVLGRCGKFLKSHKNAILGGFFGGALLFMSAGVILFGILHGKVPIDSNEMPVLVLFGEGNTFLFLSIMTAMLVSALTGLTGTCVFFDSIINEKKLGFILGIIAIPLSYISFGDLMDFLYPIFGFVGIFLMIMLALSGGKKV